MVYINRRAQKLKNSVYFRVQTVRATSSCIRIHVWEIFQTRRDRMTNCSAYGAKNAVKYTILIQNVEWITIYSEGWLILSFFAFFLGSLVNQNTWIFKYNRFNLIERFNIIVAFFSAVMQRYVKEEIQSYLPGDV